MANPNVPTNPGHETVVEREIRKLKQRLVDEATTAVGMLEAALTALFALDREGAQQIRRRDDIIDQEEVEIEEECFRLISLKQPYGHDFRMIAFILKVNADVERIADNASSIAKIVRQFPEGEAPQWPTAVKELAQRVPMRCHQLLRAVLNEDEWAARELIKTDETIDLIERGLFEETVAMMQQHPDQVRHGLLIVRIGRSLERVGDLLANIAEDVVYLTTGEIVRHSKRKGTPREQTPPAPEDLE